VTAPLEQALASWFSSKLDTEHVELSQLRRHTEGFSWQTYTMLARWTDSLGAACEQGYAVRVEPTDGLLAPYDIDGQFSLHEAVLRQPGIPMARLFWLEKDPSILGMPFYVMERVIGKVPVQWQAQDPEMFPTSEARHKIGLEFVDALAAIHAVELSGDWLGHFDAVTDPKASALAQVEHWAAYFENSALVPIPTIDYALSWLRRNLAYSPTVTLVHGDYRLGNFMIRDGSIVSIFDWELAHVSDAVEDIAYSGMPLFRGRNPMLSHLLMPDEYFAYYESLTGLRVDPDVFHFWTVLGLVKATASHVRASRSFQDGRGDDLRLAAMGHQVQFVVRHVANVLGLRQVA
jgi:aminoglycoside phosphotransferase (APT) family kinase protein